MTLNELEKKFPEAFAALPEPYQADSCLEFGVDDFGILYARPIASQVAHLGNWTAHFYNDQWIY